MQTRHKSKIAAILLALCIIPVSVFACPCSQVQDEREALMEQDQQSDQE